LTNPTGGFGLKPIRTRSGAPWTVEKVYISSSYATALYIGTPVLLSPTLAEKQILIILADCTTLHQLNGLHTL
jgi:hypothetical protein